MFWDKELVPESPGLTVLRVKRKKTPTKTQNKATVTNRPSISVTHCTAFFLRALFGLALALALISFQGRKPKGASFLCEMIEDAEPQLYHSSSSFLLYQPQFKASHTPPKQLMIL